VHEKDSERLDPRPTREFPEGVGGYGADGSEDSQHSSPEPDPATAHDEHGAGQLYEDGQSRHGCRRRHAGFDHFRNRTPQVADLAQPGDQVIHHQRQTRARPGPPP